MDSAVLDRIRALLTLSERGATEGECEAAMSGVHRLLLKYGLTLSDIPDSDENQLMRCPHDTGIKVGQSFDWVSELILAVETLCPVKGYISEHATYIVMWVGRTVDVEAAFGLFVYLLASAMSAYPSGPLTIASFLSRGNSKDSFLDGYADRVRERANEIRRQEKRHSGNLLAIADNQRSQIELAVERFLGSTGEYSSRVRSVDSYSYSKGYESGENPELSPRLTLN